MKRIFLAAVLLISLLSSAQIAENKWNKASYVTVSTPDSVTLTKTKPARAIVWFRVNPGFHVNSNKPTSDLLIPTEIKFDASPAITVGKLLYPVGKEFALSFSPKQKLSVYQGEVAVTVPLTALKRAKAGVYTLKGSLNYQACNDNACFPPKSAPFVLSVRVE